MSGRFTGMRHVMVKSDIITRTSKLVRAGVMEEPEWLQVMKRLPPQGVPPREGKKPPRIVLPTDKLYFKREAKDTHGVSQPWFAHGEVQSATLLFAQRQWRAMQTQGLSEDDAYVEVERQMAKLRTDSYDQIKALTAAAEAEGASVPALLGGGLHRKAAGAGAGSERADARGGGGGGAVMGQLLAWQQKLSDTPYSEWKVTDKVMLDHWVCKTALGWGWEQERFLQDKDFSKELAELRSALFPDLEAGRSGTGAASAAAAAASSPLASLSAEEEGLAAAAEGELEALVEQADWEDPYMGQQIQDWYVALGKWQTRVFMKPSYADWRPEEKDDLDQWILTKCLPATALLGLSDEGAAGELARVRWQLLPRLNPDYDGTAAGSAADILPDTKFVKRLIIANESAKGNAGGRLPESASRGLGLAAIRMLERTGQEEEGEGGGGEWGDVDELEDEACEDDDDDGDRGSSSAAGQWELNAQGQLVEVKRAAAAAGASEEDAAKAKAMAAVQKAWERAERAAIRAGFTEARWKKREEAREEVLAQELDKQFKHRREKALGLELSEVETKRLALKWALDLESLYQPAKPLGGQGDAHGLHPNDRDKGGGGVGGFAEKGAFADRDEVAGYDDDEEEEEEEEDIGYLVDEAGRLPRGVTGGDLNRPGRRL